MRRPAQTYRASLADVGAQREVKAGAVACYAHEEETGPFEGVGHLEPSCVEGTETETLQQCRHLRLRLGAVAREERIQRRIPAPRRPPRGACGRPRPSCPASLR